ncbi:MAG TPA: hypothetical protein VKR56_04315 [Candidatus Cybelea sp.]|nr:hypothetical protein [Candidatus Cybelea sp.]
MRVFFASLCAIALAAFIAFPAPAKAADTMLTGKMAPFNYLLGAPWSCTSQVPAMHDMPAHTDQLTVTFEIAPRNIIHDHVSGTDYMGDQYFGYSSRMSNYWTTSADNEASHGIATSTDGRTFTGTVHMGMMAMDVTTTYGKSGANSISMTQLLSGGGQSITVSSSCTR